MTAKAMPEEPFRILPCGFLRDASRRDVASAHGFAAVDAEGAGPEGTLHVRGWGMSEDLALQAAARLGFPSEKLEVYPCSRTLFSELGRGERPCNVSIDVAYSLHEETPWAVAWAWAEEIFRRNRPDGWSEERWQPFAFLLDTVLSAYLKGTTGSVGVRDDGIVGWTPAAKRRAEPEAGSPIAPMATEIVQATMEVADNIEAAKDIRAALKRQLKKFRGKAGRPN